MKAQSGTRGVILLFL